MAAIRISPDKRTPDGIYRCGTTRFGALIGDGVQTGNTVSLNPGVAIGPRTRIHSGVTLTTRTIPADAVATTPHTSEAPVRAQRGTG
ncbi:hypothetical protein [Streptomyces sp. NPDC058674]|uniref:hypothetical protein n=1 Tax=Streptomyces sp. NPDC058674 TaxID=3346592 RepID=UPI003664CD76